jgi:hypothetical protein
MRNYVIKIECKLYGKTHNDVPSMILNYCSFSLPTERANSLIPLGLHNIEIHEQPIYKIESKIFDAPFSNSDEHTKIVLRLKHHLNIKQEVDEWLSLISASNIKYFDKITLTSCKDECCYDSIYAIGTFDIECFAKSAI